YIIMVLEHLSLLNFKNIAQGELDFSNSLNCFVGPNGSGKTNILDAIHYLSLTRSAVGVSDLQCVKHEGENFFIVKGNYITPQGRAEQISVSYRRSSGKKVMRGGKEYDRLMNHIGLIPVVMISPCDTYLISEAADERRRFLNTHLSQTDAEYMATLSRYNSLLIERNRLLKNPIGFDDVLVILNEQMADLATVIYHKRAAFVEQLAPIVAEYYCAISGDTETAGVAYRSALSSESMIDILHRTMERDYVLGYTSFGVHRDELDLFIGDYPIRRYGSQGQQKSMLIAMRLAQAKMVERTNAQKVILLLDDIFDKLDSSRVRNLIQLVSSEDFGQIFITDSNKVRLESIVECFSSDYKLFTVSQGEIIP
ncbi:MAG: DNA replication and repair protein RecF, partial [Mucinivorans sp.]